MLSWRQTIDKVGQLYRSSDAGFSNAIYTTIAEINIDWSPIKLRKYELRKQFFVKYLSYGICCLTKWYRCSVNSFKRHLSFGVICICNNKSELMLMRRATASV